MAKDNRTYMLRVRLTPRELKMLTTLSKLRGMSASDVVRQGIIQEARKEKRAA
jgi:hypothetical protein